MRCFISICVWPRAHIVFNLLLYANKFGLWPCLHFCFIKLLDNNYYHIIVIINEYIRVYEGHKIETDLFWEILLLSVHLAFVILLLRHLQHVVGTSCC